MRFETTISVPTRHVGRLTTILTNAGCTVLDRGERTTTEDGVGAEASLNVLYVPAEVDDLAVVGVSR